ncbi:terminase [Pediococcus pentosaceus]|uniref:helix-turn-helix domain-containing protein n=1 Tax=Pediococcus pentosaceus TaxID=1255 RepID=UPI001C1EF4BB|nr:helix-turn-helix domain-containing protein [Pediococcus pentosaceus]MBU7003898.1 terminase [Pediococcus pentosaceus]MCG9226413.1 helix-turn-helix domain-containing protein [Pediococcus pentosaceus]MDA8037007.1 helix-turn-helix domain-containing protein [Pediococcus pentosaceus]
MSKQEQAEKDYLSGMKYKDIAEKYDVSINTVKSWKKRYNWQRGSKKGASPPEKRVHTKVKKGAHKKEDANDELNAKQELFCQLVGAKRLPLYRAYMIAYQVAVDTNAVRVKASRLRSNPKIDERIVNIQREVAAKHKWSLDTVVGELTFVHDAAKADIIMDGLRKANSDAMLNSLDRITSLLHISDEGVKAKAEAEIAEARAKSVDTSFNDEDRTIILDDMEDDN